MDGKRTLVDASDDKPHATKRPMINFPDTPSNHHSSGLFSPQADANFDCSLEMDLDDNYCNYDTKSSVPTLLGHEFPNFGVPTTDAHLSPSGL